MREKLKPLSKLKSMAIVCGGSVGFFSGMCLYQENEQFYERVLMPAVHTLSPESAHKLVITATKYHLVPKSPYRDPSSLSTKLYNMNLTSPIGMAAGFDKDAQSISGLLKLGFGFIEVGTVTPKPQPGNEKPRVFRINNQSAIINRYGFNSEGYDSILQRVQEAKKKGLQGYVGVNIGTNKESSDPISDYVMGVTLFAPIADYVVINISSPNTPGLRAWQEKEQLEVMMREVVKARNSANKTTPLLVKLSPDLTETERKDVAKVLLSPDCRVDGLIISNTTIGRKAIENEPLSKESGGLSGRPLKDVSTKMISDMYTLTKGELPIVGVGGIFTGEDAYEKIKAGASLLQLYTAFIYHGPPRIARIKKELFTLLQADGYSSISQAVGKDTLTSQKSMSK